MNLRPSDWVLKTPQHARRPRDTLEIIMLVQILKIDLSAADIYNIELPLLFILWLFDNYITAVYLSFNIRISSYDILFLTVHLQMYVNNLTNSQQSNIINCSYILPPHYI